MLTVLIALVFVGLAFLGIAIRLVLLKNGEFKGTCASQSPFLKNQIGECTVCGKKPDEECKMDEKDAQNLAAS